jgi:hypothetical protein
MQPGKRVIAANNGFTAEGERELRELWIELRWGSLFDRGTRPVKAAKGVAKPTED